MEKELPLKQENIFLSVAFFFALRGSTQKNKYSAHYRCPERRLFCSWQRKFSEVLLTRQISSNNSVHGLETTGAKQAFFGKIVIREMYAFPVT